MSVITPRAITKVWNHFQFYIYQHSVKIHLIIQKKKLFFPNDEMFLINSWERCELASVIKIRNTRKKSFAVWHFYRLEQVWE